MVIAESPGAAALRGQGASRGHGRGRARWVTSPEEAMAVPAGAVVLARRLPAAWVPLLGGPAAVAAVRGGALANATTALRERGVPAVFGAGEALEAIRDGELVDVDGGGGSIAVVAAGSRWA
jgi:phosphohistidine swiveling domain-containing protein